MQASQKWWHASLIRSCNELQVWRGPAEGEPGASTFRSYVGQIVQHALSPHPKVFLQALQDFVEALPILTLAAVEQFFTEAPCSISDPIAIVARHYLKLLHEEAAANTPETSIAVADLSDLLEGFQRLVGPALERSHPRTVVLAFLSLAALCDLRHQRRLCAESLSALLMVECRPDGNETRFW